MNRDAATAMVEIFRGYRRMQGPWLDCRLATFRAFRDGGMEIADIRGPRGALSLALWEEVCKEAP